MHIAVANPQSLDVDGLDKALIERERAVLTEQAKEFGKPAPVIEKMVEGRLRKFYEEVVLLAQTFVHDAETTVAKAMDAAEQGGRRADQDHGFPPVCLGRGHRPARKRFRGRGCRRGVAILGWSARGLVLRARSQTRHSRRSLS